MKTKQQSRFLAALDKHILILDGAMGTNLDLQELTPEDYGGEQYQGCNDHLNITCPEAVEKVHKSFLEAGADVIETNTFRSNRLTLAEFGLEDKVTEINERAAKIARSCADHYSTEDFPRYVAGSMGPTGKLISMNDDEMSDISYQELADIFREQAEALIKGGVDVLLLETQQDILEIKAAVEGILQAFENTKTTLPIQAQITLDSSGHMLLGTDAETAMTILNGLPIDIVGINCSTGPEEMVETVKFLGENSSKRVSCIPNAGLPINMDGEAFYPMKPDEFQNHLQKFVDEYHIDLIGGCCGTKPEHIKTLYDHLHRHPVSKKPAEHHGNLASAISTVPMEQNPKPFLIGERLNTQGSRKFKRLLLENDFESIVEIAKHQINNGAHALDICVALTERNTEAEDVQKVIKTLVPISTVPFVIDSTDPKVIKTALQNAPGRCLINSTNLENGRDHADQIFSLAKRYNAAVIVLTIDEEGMAKTAARKLEISERIYKIAVEEHGLQPEDLVFDPLTFTLATGDDSLRFTAIETLNGIKSIKEKLPGVFTSLGVSNVSYGLPPAVRPVLNSIMLYHAIQNGLDMAIVDPAKITPYFEIPENLRQVTEALIFNQNDQALENLLAETEFLVENKTALQQQSSSELDQLSNEEKLAWKIVHRDKTDIEDIISTIFTSIDKENHHATAIDLINNYLLPGMQEVGDRFEKGEIILPFVLQSAEVMKVTVDRVETYLDKQSGKSKGKIVLATVYGDVHDIGKNLVKTILVNNGYEVIDLGKQVPVEKIVKTAVDEKANAVGLSALLVNTSKQMPLVVNALYNSGLDIPVLIGGAAINQSFADSIQTVEDGNKYPGGVVYCKDAFDGLKKLEKYS